MKLTAEITPFQFYTVLFLSRVFAMVTYVAGVREALTSTDEVIAAVVTGIFLLITAIPVVLFLRKDNKSSIITRAECISPVFSKILCIFYLVAYLWFGIITSVRFGIFTGSVMFPDTDVLFFIVMMLAASSYIALKGIECIGRSSVIILIPVIGAMIFVFATQSERFDILNFTHPFTDSIKDIAASGFYSASRTGELAFPVLLAPFVKKQKGKHVFSWIFIITAVITVTEIILSGVLGKFGSTQLFSMYSLSVLAQTGFIERLDAIITCMWLLCAAVKISITLFLCGNLFSSLIGKQKNVLFILLSAVVIFAGTMPLADNLISLTEIIRSPLTFIFFLVTVCIIPVAVMLSEKLKERKKHEKA